MRHLGLSVGEIYMVRGRKVEASVVYERFCLKKEQARALCAPAASCLAIVAQRSLSVVANFS